MAIINGTPSNDVYDATETDDVLFGGAGNDVLTGRGGADRLFGDLAGSNPSVTGNDTIAGGAGGDLIIGGPGFDIAIMDLPRRSYTGQLTSLDFSQFAQAEGQPQILPATILATAGAGSSPEVDFLIEIEEVRFPDGRVVSNQDDPIAAVYRVYEAALDRAPDPIGLNAGAAQVATGASLSTVAGAVAQSAEFQARYGALGNGAFVEQVYQNALGRAGDAEGIASWTAALDAGASRGDVVAAFSGTDEAKANVSAVFASGVWDQDERGAQLARLYDAALGRAPDFAGYQTSKAAMDGGASLEQTARDMVQSPEFAALYGGANAAPETLVNALYANALDRPADAAGLAFWTQSIASGATSREQAVVAFSESLEHQTLMLPSIEGGIVFA